MSNVLSKTGAAERPQRREGLGFGHTALCMHETEYLLGRSVCGAALVPVPGFAHASRLDGHIQTVRVELCASCRPSRCLGAWMLGLDSEEAALWLSASALQGRNAG